MQTNEAVILEGKIIAAKIQEEIKSSVEDFLSKKLARPRLSAIQVGNDPSANWYLDQQEKLAKKLGIEFERMPVNLVSNQDELEFHIDEASHDTDIHGIFITMPLPEGFNPDKALLPKIVEIPRPVSSEFT